MNKRGLKKEAKKEYHELMREIKNIDMSKFKGELEALPNKLTSENIGKLREIEYKYNSIAAQQVRKEKNMFDTKLQELIRLCDTRIIELNNQTTLQSC